jgi:hypothetical protein
MNLIPLVGTDEVTFGTHEQKIIKLLGRPTSRDPDTLHYEEPHWHYSLRYNLSSSDRQLISIDIGLSSLTYPADNIFLWGTDISECSSYQLLHLLRLKQSGEKIVDEWHEGGDWDIEVFDGGIFVKDFSNGDWDIELPDCGIRIQCLGDEVECITISAVD